MFVLAAAQSQEDLKLRVIEHNIMVVARYYTCITTQRLAHLLGLPMEQVCLILRVLVHPATITPPSLDFENVDGNTCE